MYSSIKSCIIYFFIICYSSNYWLSTSSVYWLFLEMKFFKTPARISRKPLKFLTVNFQEFFTAIKSMTWVEPVAFKLFKYWISCREPQEHFLVPLKAAIFWILRYTMKISFHINHNFIIKKQHRERSHNT